MVSIIVGSSVVAAVTDTTTYIKARKEADELALEHGLRVADMPMVMQAMDQYAEVRQAIRKAWIDTLSSEYHGLRDGKRSYEVWHSVGSLATTEGLGNARSQMGAYGFIPIANDEWVAVEKGNYNGQNVPRIHLEDVRRNNMPTAGTPYTVFLRLDKDRFKIDTSINTSGCLGYDAFMRDDRVLMVTGSPESRATLAQMLFGRKEDSGEGHNLVGSYHKFVDVNFDDRAKGRVLFVGSSFLGLDGRVLEYDGRFVGVRSGSAHAQKNAAEDAVRTALESGKPIDDILRNLSLTEQRQRGRISELEQQLARMNASEKELAEIKSQMKEGSITIDRRQYSIVSREEAQFLEKVRAGQPFKTQTHEYSAIGLKKKGKTLEFD